MIDVERDTHTQRDTETKRDKERERVRRERKNYTIKKQTKSITFYITEVFFYHDFIFVISPINACHFVPNLVTNFNFSSI